jgi:predicted Zn-dependent protease with MMP-like domain
MCESPEDVALEIRDTVIHELGHHMGLSDEEMPY